MSPRQKTRIQGKPTHRLQGLSGDVQRVLERLTNVQGITLGRIAPYTGQSKVKIDEWWKHKKYVVVYVCDGEYGKRELIVLTHQRGPIAKHLGRQLQQQGVVVT